MSIDNATASATRQAYEPHPDDPNMDALQNSKLAPAASPAQVNAVDASGPSDAPADKEAIRRTMDWGRSQFTGEGFGVAAAGPARPAPDPQWTPIDPAKAQQIIDDTLAKHGGNIDDADAELIGLRNDPAGQYDSNLALADDHLYARILTREVGPDTARGMIGAYLLAKQAGALPPTGPGPVSPYSDELRNAMLSGVAVETAQTSPDRLAYWPTPVGRVESLAKAASIVVRR
jgi:hypothetical protein